MKKLIVKLLTLTLPLGAFTSVHGQITRKQHQSFDNDTIEHVVIDGDTMSIVLPLRPRSEKLSFYPERKMELRNDGVLR